MIKSCESVEQPGWLTLREILWPDSDRIRHLQEMSSQLASPNRYAQFVDYSDSEEPQGFLEVSIRTDYVNGTRNSPVAFLEGIFVTPAARRKGVASRLVAEAENWARGRGCLELASDAFLANTLSQAVHEKLGFEETERVIFFRKDVR
ncbi:MAG: aminoglycoside 6'-N-acetyltransferase [Pseudomonadota bacterium]